MKAHKPLHERIFAIFGIVMAVVYVALGLVLVFTPLGASVFSKEVKMAFGAAISLYGLFRLYRAATQLAS